MARGTTTARDGSAGAVKHKLRRKGEEADAIALWMFEHAANAGRPAPSNAEIAVACDLARTNSACIVVNRLVKRGLISVERGSISRVVTITATGKRTAGTIDKPRRYGPGSRSPRFAAENVRLRLPMPPRNQSAAAYDPPVAREAVETRTCFFCGATSLAGCRHQQPTYDAAHHGATAIAPAAQSEKANKELTIKHMVVNG